jgi:anti-anti-sigma factor
VITLAVPSRAVASHLGHGRVLASGEFDMASRELLRDALAAAIADEPTTIRIDASGVRFLDATTISLLVAAQRTADEQGIRLTVAHAPRFIARVLHLAGVCQVLGVPEPATGAGVRGGVPDADGA